MSTYARTIAKLDSALDTLDDVGTDLVGRDKDALAEALILIKPVRDRLVGADHDEDRRRRFDPEPPAPTRPDPGVPERADVDPPEPPHRRRRIVTDDGDVLKDAEV